MKIGRNAPCPCGSGRKYKNCCLRKEAVTALGQKLLGALIVLMLAGGAIAAVVSLVKEQPGPRQVWSEEHQHWHTVP